MPTDAGGRRGRFLSGRLPGDFEPNELARLVDRRRRSGEPILDLAETNPTRAGLPALDAEGLRALAPPALSRYEPAPLGLPPAREAVAAYLTARAVTSGATAAPPVHPDSVVLTAGTSEGHAHLLRLLCDPGERVLAPRPSYPLLAPIAAVEGVALQTYRLAHDGARWRVDLDSVEAGLREGTRAVVVVEPNNPTGSCLDAGERAALESLCERHGAAIVSDEVFGDFPWPPREAPLPGFWGERRAPTFVLGGISKLCGLPQLKLGWIAVAGPGPARRAALQGLEWIADLFLSVGSAVQLALPGLLESRHAFRRRAAERIAANLSALRATAARTGAYEPLGGEGGWSAVLRACGGGAREPGGVPALERGVHLHPGHFYDLPDDRHAVVSLLPEPGVFRSGVERIAEMLLEDPR
jgi:hypothetical protein